LIDNLTRQPLRKLVLQAADGRTLRPDDITARLPVTD
jgi:hypothetical protein